MRVLIGYDGSKAAMAALRDLRRAGLPDKAEAIILSVAESWRRPMTVEDAADIAAVARAFVCSNFPGWTVMAEATSGNPAFEILARAEAFEPDLIIVGESHHETGAGDNGPGAASQKVLAGAGRSVRIGRGNSNPRSIVKRILVGFDGSAGAAHAVDSIVSRMWPAETHVRLLAVADFSVLNSIGRFTPRMNDAVIEAKFAMQWAETLAGAPIEKLRRAGIPSSVEVQFGDPRHVIVDEAERWNADAIFVGPNGARDSFEGTLIGSVSAAVAERAHCSVEVVRTPFHGILG